MTALIITLGFLAILAIAMVVPGALWAGAPDRRGEVRRLGTSSAAGPNRSAA
jgi:hypothetical protein